MVDNRLSLGYVTSNLGVFMEGDPAALHCQLDPFVIANSLPVLFAVVLAQRCQREARCF